MDGNWWQLHNGSGMSDGAFSIEWKIRWKIHLQDQESYGQLPSGYD